MKKTILLFALLASASVSAQTVDPATQINWPRVTGSGAPTLTCTSGNYGQPYTDTAATPNAYYVCGATGWQKLSFAAEHNGTAFAVPGLANFLDTPTGGIPAGYQAVTPSVDSSSGIGFYTLAGSNFAAFTSPPIAGQYVIVYPVSSTIAGCAAGNAKSGSVQQIGGDPTCGGAASVTWAFNTSAFPSGLSISQVTAVYPFVVSSTTIQTTFGSGNSFNNICSGAGVDLDIGYGDLGFQTNQTYPSQQYTSSTSLSVSAANFNAMTCQIITGMTDGAVGTPRSVVGNATLVGAYVYYTGTPVTQPSQVYVQTPLQFDSNTSTLSLSLPFDAALDVGTANGYVVENSSFTQPMAGLKATFCAQHASTSATPTLNMNGWGAWTIVGPTGGALSSGDIANCPSTGVETQVILGGNNKWFLQNPQVSGGGAVSSVSNSDGSLTFSPTTGAVVGSINYAHAGTWTGLETFSAGVAASALTLSSITGTQCLHSVSGVVSGTGSDCGSGGGGGSPGGVSGSIQYNNSGAFGGIDMGTVANVPLVSNGSHGGQLASGTISTGGTGTSIYNVTTTTIGNLGTLTGLAANTSEVQVTDASVCGDTSSGGGSVTEILRYLGSSSWSVVACAPPSGTANGLFSNAVFLPTVAGTGFTTALNQSTTFTATDAVTGILLKDTVAQTATNSAEGIAKAYPATPFTATFLAAMPLPNGTYDEGLIIVSSGVLSTSPNYQFQFGNYNSATTTSIVLQTCSDLTHSATCTIVGAVTQISAGITPYLWLQYQDDGTNIYFRYSTDGSNFVQFYTIAKASSYLSGTGFNDIGVALAPFTVATAYTLLSYQQN